jgi:hypothetical protein
MKKHQLFRNKSYAQVKIHSNLSIVGQVKDSTVKKVSASYGDVFDIPVETLTFEKEILFNYGHTTAVYDVTEDFFQLHIMNRSKELQHTIFFSEEGDVILRCSDLDVVDDESLKVELRKERSRLKLTK